LFSACPAPNHAFFAIADKFHRDMIWSLVGPSLLAESCTISTEALFGRNATDRLFNADLTAPDYNSPRLGFCFEQLWQLALTTLDIPFLQNLQIHGEASDPNVRQRTIGELDLVLTDRQPPLHLELALKFYLGVEHDWVGPNQRDLLSQKLQHTFSHQLPLGRQTETLKELSQQQLAAPRSHAIMRGCLFHPAHALTPATLPEAVSECHWRGQWCRLTDCDTLLPDGDWYVLSKPDWMSPVLADFGIPRSELLRYLQAYFRHLKTPIALARVGKGPYGWAEQARWMVVSDHWLSA